MCNSAKLVNMTAYFYSKMFIVRVKGGNFAPNSCFIAYYV